MRKEIRLAGQGGQGQVLAGIILAEAAVTYDGLKATQTQSYGPESRGGASKAEVIISDEPIDYPKVTRADLLLCMSQEGYEKYRDEVSDDSVILVDGTLVEAGDEAYSLPITGTARDKLGRVIVANIIALGVVVGLTGAVTEDAARQAVLDRVPAGTEDLNRQAFGEGLRLAREIASDR